MTTVTCFPPVRVDSLFDDPEIVRSMVRANAPYWPVMRYFGNAAEEAAQNGGKSIDRGREAALQGTSMQVMPVFRGDWAYDVPLVKGVERILHNERLIEAAKQVFGGSVVVPQIVFANLTTPMPAQPAGHVDIPAFRGIDRTKYPTWLLQMMGQSGLFEDVRVRIATAVAWFYRGENGGFSYWPEGPDGPRLVHEPPFDNTAIVGDNDFMFHRVERVGPEGARTARGLTLDSLLHPSDDDGDVWVITDFGRELERLPFEDIRISVSWKAKVFADAEDQRVADEHLDDITIDEVVDRFVGDLAERGTPIPRPDNPATDVDFIAALGAAYRRTPTTE
jgi:hypothetical protein